MNNDVQLVYDNMVRMQNQAKVTQANHKRLEANEAAARQARIEADTKLYQSIKQQDNGLFFDKLAVVVFGKPVGWALMYLASGWMIYGAHVNKEAIMALGGILLLLTALILTINVGVQSLKDDAPNELNHWSYGPFKFVGILLAYSPVILGGLFLAGVVLFYPVKFIILLALGISS